MPTLETRQQVELDPQVHAGPNTDRLLVVVGYDGSAHANRALDAATRLISGRAGRIEVVFVAHMPVGAEMSPVAQSEALKGFDDVEREFAEAIRARLDCVEQRWRFQRRDGPIAHEIIAVADQLSAYDEDASVVIVVGSAMHTYHHVAGSVPVALVRHAKYPIVVVP